MAKKQTRNKQGQFLSNRSAGRDNAQARAGQARRQYVLERLWDRAVAEGKDNIKQKESRLWMKQQASKVRDSKKRIMTPTGTDRAELTDRIRVGHAYAWHYDAITKEDLPYWDALPIGFPFQDEGDTFLSLNLHYLPPAVRAKLLDSLLTIASDSVFNDRTKLVMSYRLLKNSSKFKEIIPCIKRYRKDRVRSQFLHVNSQDWVFLCFLPLASWRKAGAQKVYYDSKKKIKKGWGR